VNFTKKYKGELHSFFLDLGSWKKFKTRYKLEWKRLRFSEESHASVPRERGIYVFTIELAPSKLPLHGYILYVGITGDTSEQDLHKRYARYLLDYKNAEGRPAVCYMLDNWWGDLFFNFVPMPNKNIDLARIEKAFINAVMPPVNKRDLEARISAPRSAAF
jgi:hypothetical protein